jgi:hypothetical protein
VKVVDLCEDIRGRARHGCLPFDAEIGGLHGNNGDENDNNGCDSDCDVNHKEFPRPQSWDIT